MVLGQSPHNERHLILLYIIKQQKGFALQSLSKDNAREKLNGSFPVYAERRPYYEA